MAKLGQDGDQVASHIDASNGNKDIFRCEQLRLNFFWPASTAFQSPRRPISVSIRGKSVRVAGLKFLQRAARSSQELRIDTAGKKRSVQLSVQVLGFPAVRATIGTVSGEPQK
jgi:hypothetical protein